MFTLLTILSIVNAIPYQFYKRATTFTPCDTDSPNDITVTITPDPLIAGEKGTFNIVGTITNGTVNTGSQLVIELKDDADAVIGDPSTFDICASATCPITDLNLTQVIQLPDTLPNTFIIDVNIFDVNGDTLACATSAVPGA
ncbi:hypothetical protein RclHR1_04540006 [Rhizophagus clarus]|nr:hypothetical protein RclHR1_04540006 [Rhizophagus clarus]